MGHLDDVTKSFQIRPDQRVAVFIDGPSLHHVTKMLGWMINYKKLRQEIESSAMLYRMMYFTAVPEFNDENSPHSPVIKLVDWLCNNEYRVVTKPLREFTDTEGRRRVKGNLQVEIAVEMMEAVAFCDVLLLFSGDGELAYAVDAVQRKGARVYVVSTTKTSGKFCADELRRYADKFIELSQVRPLIENDEPAKAQGSRPSAPRGEAEVIGPLPLRTALR